MDLNTFIGGAGVPDGWQIIAALDINDQGIIVGALSPSNDEGVNVRAGFVLDIYAQAPQVALLPNFGGWDYTYARQINENGDILGVYEVSDGSTGLYFYNQATSTRPQR